MPSKSQKKKLSNGFQKNSDRFFQKKRYIGREIKFAFEQHPGSVLNARTN